MIHCPSNAIEATRYRTATARSPPASERGDHDEIMQRTPPPPTRPGPRPASLPALVSNHVMEREATIMPVQTNPEIGAVDLTAFGEAAKALFSTADTPEEVAAMRDEVLRRIAECAAATRQSIAESERTPHDE